jgi:CheY-like chemotaxis protein
LILLDYLLPDMSSVEICQQLTTDPRTRDVPVVVMSANPPSVLDAFRRFATVVDFVAKPFSVTSIRGQLEAALAGGAVIDAVEPPAVAAPAAGRTAGLHLAGDLVQVALLDVLRLLTNGRLTGEITVHAGDTARIYVRRGEVLMCTTSQVDEDALTAGLAGAPPSASLDAARAAQVATGKPALISLAQEGRVRVTELPALLHAASGRILQALLEARAGRFEWTPATALPDFVDAFGRHVSVTSLSLAQHRRGGDAPSISGAFLEEVYDRTPRFSEKLDGARLVGEEQRLLAAIDGRSTVREIIARVGIPSDRAAAVLSRLRNVDLIRCDAVSAVSHLHAGAIAVLDPDREGFIEPLRGHLARRPQPIELAEIAASELGAAVHALRPRLLLINARYVLAAPVARELATLSQINVPIAAVLDTPEPGEIQRLLDASVHAVLVKPVHLNELERLLSL